MASIITDQDYMRSLFAKNLRRLMYADNLSQKELADKVGVAPSAVSSWCSGNKLPRTETVQQLADIFGVEISELLSEGAATTILQRHERQTNNYTEQTPIAITGTISVEDIALAQQISKLDPQIRRLIMYLLKFYEQENENSR